MPVPESHLMPDIIHADPDEHDVGILRQDIIVHPQIKVIYLIAADACADKVILSGNTLLVKRILSSA